MGYGDISPKTAIEQVIIMILMITHIMLFGLLIGSMSEVVKFSGSQAKETYKEKIVDVGHWIQSRKLAPALAKKVHVSWCLHQSMLMTSSGASNHIDLYILSNFILDSVLCITSGILFGGHSTD